MNLTCYSLIQIEQYVARAEFLKTAVRENRPLRRQKPRRLLGTCYIFKKQLHVHHDTNHHVVPKSMQLQTVLFRPG